MPAVLFFLIIAIFLVASGYLAARACRALRNTSKGVRVSIWCAVLILDFAFFLGRVLPYDSVALKRVIYLVGTMWLVVVLYATMAMLAMEVVRFVARRTLGNKMIRTPQMVLIATAITVVTLAYGVVNALSPVTTEYTVSTEKLSKGKELTLALVSDLHMGYAVTTSDMSKLATRINQASPDYVFIAGDLIDGDLLPVREEDTGRELEKIRSRRGTYAIMGNHEYLDDNKEAEAYLRTIKGLTLLRDSAVVDGGLCIIGRDDVSVRRALRHERKQLGELIPDSVGNRISVVLDHQPIGIDDAAQSNVDLLFCGHTHAGQVWPMGIITGMLFQLDYGRANFGGSLTAIVTSGFGTWGPRVRIGNQPEVVVVHLVGSHSEANR